MIHDIDLILDFAGTDLVQVDAVGVPILTPTNDIVNARFRFANGCVANVTASRISAKSLRKIRVFQRDAYLSADCGKGEALVYRRLSPSKQGGIPEIVAQRLSVEEKDTLLEEVRSFVEAVRNRKPPVIDGATGIRCLEVARRVLDEIERCVPEEFRRNLWD
jgi:predicted dehydrogenase